MDWESQSDSVPDPEKAPVHMVQAVMGFNGQIERVLEVALVLLVGTMLAPSYLNLSTATCSASLTRRLLRLSTTRYSAGC
jgi:hypothetical protein